MMIQDPWRCPHCSSTLFSIQTGCNDDREHQGDEWLSTSSVACHACGALMLKVEVRAQSGARSTGPLAADQGLAPSHPAQSR